jgi:capsular exopolysaccharide synthesis family protein
MGKMHEALERAEAQRARLGGAPGGPATTQELVELPEKPRKVRRRFRRQQSDRKSQRGRHVREARRARVVLNQTESLVTEQFCSLRGRIHSIRRTRPIRSIVITSALPREGKTTTAVNLAISFGLDIEKNTCLVDADLRTPGVHRALPNLPDAGLAEVLEQDAKLDEALVAVPDTRLSVLAIRALPPHPSELLASRRMVDLIDELNARFDTVLIDSPPIIGVPDATTLIDICDAAVLVVGAGRSTPEDIDSALERVDAEKVLGVVFNRCDTVPKPYGGAYGEGDS